MLQERTSLIIRWDFGCQPTGLLNKKNNRAQKIEEGKNASQTIKKFRIATKKLILNSLKIKVIKGDQSGYSLVVKLSLNCWSKLRN